MCSIANEAKQQIKKANSVLLIDNLLCNAKIAMNSIRPKESEIIKDGVYFITKLSWEKYVRDWAKSTEKDESWINNLLNQNCQENFPAGMADKEQLKAVIANGQIVVSDARSYCYDFFDDDNIYKGKFAENEFSFWCLDDCLYVNKSNSLMVYKLDVSYIMSSDTPEKLDKPQNVEIINNNSVSANKSLYWNYLSAYGSLGARVEVKTPSSQIFTAVKYLTVYSNNFAFSLNDLTFEEGENFVRVCHIGGPIIKGNFVELTEDSDFATYSIEVANDSIIRIQKL